MNLFRLVVVVCAVLSPALASAEPDYRALSDAELVDALVTLDNQAEGAGGLVIGASFDATRAKLLADCPPQQAEPRPTNAIPFELLAQIEVLAPPAPVSSPVVDEIVRRGAQVLPELIDHLEDTRETHFLMATEEYSPARGQWLSGVTWGNWDDTYDPRYGPPTRVNSGFGGAFHGDYYPQVGDLAFFLIGQILNRDYGIVWGAPTDGVILRSPIKFPSLAERIRSDWGRIDPESLQKSLLADAELSEDSREYKYRREGAWTRLRYYFPAEYAALDGEQGAARDANLKRLCDERRPVYLPADPAPAIRRNVGELTPLRRLLEEPPAS